MLNNAYDKLISKVSLINDMMVEIYFAPTIADSPVLPTIFRAHADLMEAGWANYSHLTNNRSKAVYAVLDQKIVGFMTYDFQDDIWKTCWVYLSFVDPNFRQNGIFKVLHKHLEDQAQKNGSRKICSLVHTDNQPMIASGISVGRYPNYLRTEKKL